MAKNNKILYHLNVSEKILNSQTQQNQELEDLRAKIRLFNAEYEKGTPLVQDYVYDFYKKRLRILEATYTTKISNEIGPEAQDKIKHLFPILSLDHDFGLSGFENFLKKMQKNCDPFPFIGELKVDGISIVARYENGFLTTIATRGNGVFGENITHLKNHLALPNEISLTGILDLRCEAYINKNIMKNPRNAVAGMLLKKEPDLNLKFVKFAPHNLYSADEIWQEYTQLRHIFEEIFHLEPISPFKTCQNINEMHEFFENVQKIKDDLDFEIDGTVFKINEKAKQMSLGHTSTAPKYAFAIKFENPFAISKITKIQFQVAKSGRITPVAIVETATIKDRKIQKATLNNFDDLTRNGYAPGDIVKIEMAGEVIPMISEIIEKSAEILELPKTCPSCGSNLKYDNCENGWSCPAQKQERLTYFASKNGLNIQGMGEKQIEFFISQQMLEFPYDFFELKNRANMIKQNPSWLAEKAFSNLLESIEIARYSTLEAWYMSLGLPNIGRTKSQNLASNFPIFGDFLAAKAEDFTFLGPEIAQQIFEYKTREKWIEKTWSYMKIGQKFENDEITLFQ